MMTEDDMLKDEIFSEMMAAMSILSDVQEHLARLKEKVAIPKSIGPVMINATVNHAKKHLVNAMESYGRAAGLPIELVVTGGDDDKDAQMDDSP